MEIGRDLTVNLRFDEWRRETEPVFTYTQDSYQAAIMLGHPDTEGEDGATLWWTDYVTSEWGEWYGDVETALVRVAALIRCVDREEFFKDGPAGFTRWSENFFVQTVSNTPKPTGL